jgi:alanine racemase
VGYSATFRAKGPRRIATIAAGYADGLFRHLSAGDGETGGQISINGHLAPIAGRVSMDLITVDVTDVPGAPAKRGDLVCVIGDDIPIEAVGAAAGTIGYEVLTSLGRRFHRVYLDGDA